MKKPYYIFLWIFLGSLVQLQAQNNESAKDSIYSVVEEIPQYPGGTEAMLQYLKSNIQYPQKAIENGFEGNVFVNFVVEKDGSISQVKTLRGIGGGCNEEAERVVKTMPAWKPGKVKGEAVRTQFTIPIRFDLKAKVESDVVVNIDVTKKDSTMEEVFMLVEEAPKYPGGEEARMKFLRENIKYPKMAIKNNIQGTVYASFVVEKDGSISTIKILKGIGGGCDEEVIRLLKQMPKWEPGKQRGKAIRAQYNMPIKFVIPKD
jgi:TonB family protein